MRRASNGSADATRRAAASRPSSASCTRYASALKQNPPGVGSPARLSRARFAAFGPTLSGFIASVDSRGISSSWPVVTVSSPFAPTLPANPGVPGFGNHEWVDIGNIRCRLRAKVRAVCGSRAGSSYVIAVAGDRIDHRDLLHREVGDDLDPFRMHDQHLLDAH